MNAAKPALMNQPRWIWWLCGGAVALLLVFFLFAPNNDWQRIGSTYNKSPDGYAAWYDYMEKRGVKLTRSRRSIAELITDQNRDPTPKTLLQVQPQLTRSGRFTNQRRSPTGEKLNSDEQKWLIAGNHLIVLGITQPVEKVSFSSRVGSPQGLVKVETGRRAKVDQTQSRLRDPAGAIVWEVVEATEGTDIPPKPTKQPPGQLIYATTPHLAANAYQAEPGNYAFLADLVTQSKTPLIIDEYIHGYREPPPPTGSKSRVKQSEPKPEQDLLSYFAQTPLLPIGVQAIVLMLIAIWAKNRRFGRVQSVDPPPVDNSTAYIQALAGALRQANSRSFVMETVNQAELRQLQRQMGLGDTTMTLPELIEAWKAQGQTTTDLSALLRMQSRKDLNDGDLLLWLQSLQRLRQGAGIEN
jgi:Domain of unknown function (DUF4350)